ncbi:MAG: hypothetical protein GY749_20665 [Desulfobacteraceae bacterium]|nr:hypothetical protein [Desulfobacteraceae bacterium]
MLIPEHPGRGASRLHSHAERGNEMRGSKSGRISHFHLYSFYNDILKGIQYDEP